MKYANYKFCAKCANNIGDNIQIIAIDHIYEHMGLEKSDIVYIDTNELATYVGEPVVLPVTMPLIEYCENGQAGRFSPYIIPCYLGLTFPNNLLTESEIQHYKKYEPIGCRDEYTLNTLRRYQINCYLHGCITQTFPEREENKNQSDIYIVDVDSSVLSYIPERIRNKAIYRTHLYSDLLNPKEKAMEQYEEYKKYAKLVITSLLHCAVPCMAAGIPVIMLRCKVSYRMAWLEKFLPIYTADNISDINWNPDPIKYPEHKEKLLSLTIKRLRETFDKFSEIMDMSWFYETRKKSIYVNDACESLKQFIDNNWLDKSAEYKYGIWGLTQMSRWIYDYISENYPNATLCHVYDSFRTIKFNGIESISPEEISKYKDEIVFVTAISAVDAAKDFFSKISKNNDTYALLIQKR